MRVPRFQWPVAETCLFSPTVLRGFATTIWPTVDLLGEPIVLSSTYVIMSGDAEPLSPRMDGLAREFANIPMDELIVGNSTAFPCPFNWKITVAAAASPGRRKLGAGEGESGAGPDRPAPSAARRPLDRPRARSGPAGVRELDGEADPDREPVP